MIREVLTPKSWLRRNAAPLAVFSGLVLGGFVGIAALEAHRSKPAPVAPSLTDVTSDNCALTMQGSTTLGNSDSLTVPRSQALGGDVHRYYDGCNWTTCAGGSCSSTLLNCESTGALSGVVSVEPLGDATADALTITQREYARIQIPADYHCTKAQRGWECVREGR